MIFKRYFYKRKIRNLIEESHIREHQFCSLDDARAILVLFRSEDQDVIAPQLKKLGTMGKKVYCCMSGHGDIALQNDLSFVYINKIKDVDRYGIPDDKTTMKVLGFPADILIDLNRGKCHTLKLLMLQHPSTFKVGERLGDESLHDFSIIMKGEGGVSDLFENLLFYLQSIRSK